MVNEVMVTLVALMVACEHQARTLMLDQKLLLLLLLAVLSMTLYR